MSEKSRISLFGKLGSPFLAVVFVFGDIFTKNFCEAQNYISNKVNVFGINFKFKMKLMEFPFLLIFTRRWVNVYCEFVQILLLYFNSQPRQKFTFELYSIRMTFKQCHDFKTCICSLLLMSAVLTFEAIRSINFYITVTYGVA